MVVTNGNIRFPIICGHCYGDISPIDDFCIWCGKRLGLLDEEDIDPIVKEEAKTSFREILSRFKQPRQKIKREIAVETVAIKCARCGKSLSASEVITHWCDDYDKALEEGRAHIYDGPRKRPDTEEPDGTKCSRCKQPFRTLPWFHECEDLIGKNPEYKKWMEKFSTTKLLKEKREHKNGVDDSDRS
jgi:DNA-directed RNA polymerase subunit RPC12/RpoP